MKREYIAPEVNVVKVHAERMLAGSDPNNVTGTIKDDEQATTGWAESRSFYFEEISEEE